MTTLGDFIQTIDAVNDRLAAITESATVAKEEALLALEENRPAGTGTPDPELAHVGVLIDDMLTRLGAAQSTANGLRAATVVLIGRPQPVKTSAPVSDEAAVDRRSWKRHLNHPKPFLTYMAVYWLWYLCSFFTHFPEIVRLSLLVAIFIPFLVATWIGNRYLKVGRSLENALYDVFGSAISEDPERFDAAMASLTAKGERFARKALRLALEVDTETLFDIHENQHPTSVRLSYLGGKFSRSQAWAQIDLGSASRFFIALADREPVEEILWRFSPKLVFVAGGWLLEHFPTVDDDEDWTDMLDDILREIERNACT